MGNRGLFTLNSNASLGSQITTDILSLNLPNDRENPCKTGYSGNVGNRYIQ